MRANRNSEMPEQTKLRQAKNAKSTDASRKSESKEKTQARLAQARKYKQERDEKESEEERLARVAKESAQRKARRHAAKAAKLTNRQNQVLTEFQRIQTAPKPLLSSRNGNSSFEPQSHQDKVGSESPDDSTSEYEKLRLRNIEERKQKFQQQFGTFDYFGGEPSAQNQKRSLPTSITNSESSDEDILAATLEPTRRQPKRQCKTLLNEVLETSAHDSSFEAHVNDLVESSVNAIDTESEAEQIVCLILEEIISLTTAAPKLEYLRSKKGQPKIGRKSKDAKRMANSRYVI